MGRGVSARASHTVVAVVVIVKVVIGVSIMVVDGRGWWCIGEE